MKLQWILLALFLITMVRNIAKSMRNPMLKNFLRLISILVAFIITFILQICGVFQSIAEKIVDKIGIGNMVPGYGNAVDNSIDWLLPFCTTLISPILFVLTFAIVLLILRLVHVNLVYKFIVKRKRRKEIREFKQALKEEKIMLKKAITENETRFMSILESIALANPGLDVYKYDTLDEDEIDRMVEERLKAEKKKKKKKKLTFFKESSERRAISLVCGVVSGFLLFGIVWMGMFYSMDFLSDVTDSIYETEAQDTKVYQIVEMVDEHVVKPYEESFVYQLYDSMAMVDLMTFTVQAGGQIENNPNYWCADELMRTHMKSAIQLACDMTTENLDEEGEKRIEKNIANLTDEDSTMIMITSEFIISFAESFDENSVDSSNPFNSMLGSIILNYKGENGRKNVTNDLKSISEVIVVASRNKLLSKIIQEDTNKLLVFKDSEMTTDLAKAMSHLSFYPTTMETAFTFGIDAFGGTLMPADNAAAYEIFVNNILNGVSELKTMSTTDLETVQNLFVGVTETTKDNKLAYIALGIRRLEEKAATEELTDEDQAKLADLNAQYDNLVNTQDYNASLYDYLLDPLYSIELLAQELIDLDLEKKRDEIQAAANEYEANANALLNDIAALVIKQEAGTITPEEQDELARLVALEDDYRKRADELINQVNALKDTIKGLADDALAHKDVFLARINQLSPFINYFMNWNNMQKPFMLANEDDSSACLPLIIDGELYICNTDILNIENLVKFVLEDDTFNDLFKDENNGDANDGEGDIDAQNTDGGNDADDADGNDYGFDISIADYIDKIPMADLLKELIITNDTDSMVEHKRVSLLNNLIIHLMMVDTTDVEANDEWLYLLLKDYVDNSTDTEDAGYKVAKKLVDAHGNHSAFEYNGITVEMMKAKLNFSNDLAIWSLEDRENDSEKLVAIIYTLLEVMDKMGKSEGDVEEAAADTDTTALLQLLISLGESMDLMGETVCLNELPYFMAEGILKNELLSTFMTPSMLYGESGYLSRVKNGELTYKGLMEDIVGKAQTVLDTIGKTEENAQ